MPSATATPPPLTFDVARQDSLLTVHHPAYTVAWDLARGGVLAYLHDRRSACTLIDARAGGPGPDLLVAVSATLEERHHELAMSAMGPATLTLYHADDGQSLRLEFAAQDPEIRIERRITLRLDSPWIEETVSLQNVADHDLLVDRYPDWAAAGKTAVAGDLYHWGVNPGGVDYVLGGLALDGDYAGSQYVTPACGYPFFYNRGRFAAMGEIAINLVAGHHGAVLPCVMAYHPERRSGLLLSVLHDRCLRYIRLANDPATQRGSIAAQVWWARWLNPGECQKVATWHLVPFTGDYGDMLDDYRHWLADRFGVVPPAADPTHLDEIFVAQIHNVVLHSLGHCDRFRPYVDYASQLGCTALWWGKPWLDSVDVDPRAWMSRCQPQTRDYRYALTDAFGDAGAIHRLVDHIHARGLANIVWVTGYGLTVFDPLYREHPEMWVRLRYPVARQATADVAGRELIPHFDNLAGVDDDSIYPPFGGATIGADTTNPHWRKFWLHNQEYWAGHGVDGIFFDSFNPMPPNYALRPWPGQISMEIVHLQRAARRLAQAANPDFFTFTEGGGYLMASVNDFTHTWHGSTAPPLPPYRSTPLSPAEEARFHRDELLSMIPGARTWATVGNVTGDSATSTGSGVRARVLSLMFGRTMPVLPMYVTGCQSQAITNEPEFWTYYRPFPADSPAPHEAAHYQWVGAMWRLRQDHPELKSGRQLLRGLSLDSPSAFGYLRQCDDALSLVLVNFAPEPVSLTVRLDWQAAGIPAPSGPFQPRDLLRPDAIAAATDAAGLQAGYTLTLPARDGAVLKLR